MTNWAGNHVYQAASLHEPTSIEHLQEVVSKARFVRVLGSGHSFNDIVDTPGVLISLRQMPPRFDLGESGRSVTVDGRARYAEVCARLNAAGYALSNLASLPHISVAGSCATATHGSGDRARSMSAAVSAMEIVNAAGELTVVDRARDRDVFNGSVVSLGALGVVTALTLELEPAFRMRQDVYEDLSMGVVADEFDEITKSADSVSMFTEWRDDSFKQVWLKRRVAATDSFEAPPRFFGAAIATEPRHPIAGISPAACTEQLGTPGPWHERLPHFRADHTPSSGVELQSEYLVARHHAVDALKAMHRVRDHFAPALQVCEVRTVAADDLWLSMAFGRESVAFHFTWLPDEAALQRVLPIVEEALAPFEPRPHWGKVFALPPAAVRRSYRKVPEFADLMTQQDPSGKFRNAFIERYFAS